MPKINRTIVCTIVGAFAVYAFVLYTEPDTPIRKHITTKSSIASKKVAGDVTSADYAVHFEPYKAKNTDPFKPKVINKDGNSAMPGFLLGSGQKSGWTLTGISVIDGERSALIENSAGETEFLKAGDKWNGLKVLAVEPDSVSLANDTGTKITMSFSQTSDAPLGAGNASAPTANNVPSVPALPSFNGAPGGGMPVPAITFPGGQPPADSGSPFGGQQNDNGDNAPSNGGGRRGRRRSGSNQSGNSAPSLARLHQSGNSAPLPARLIAVPLPNSKKSVQAVVSPAGQTSSAKVRSNDAKDKSDS